MPKYFICNINYYYRETRFSHSVATLSKDKLHEKMKYKRMLEILWVQFEITAIK